MYIHKICACGGAGTNMSPTSEVPVPDMPDINQELREQRTGWCM
jgi:hypothetical protein